MSNDALMAQLTQLLQGQQNTALSNAVNNQLVPQLSQMLRLQNGPRSKRLRSMDEISSIRRRNIDVETPNGDRVSIQEEVVWFGEEI